MFYRVLSDWEWCGVLWRLQVLRLYWSGLHISHHHHQWRPSRPVTGLQVTPASWPGPGSFTAVHRVKLPLFLQTQHSPWHYRDPQSSSEYLPFRFSGKLTTQIEVFCYVGIPRQTFLMNQSSQTVCKSFSSETFNKMLKTVWLVLEENLNTFPKYDYNLYKMFSATLAQAKPAAFKRRNWGNNEQRKPLITDGAKKWYYYCWSAC